MRIPLLIYTPRTILRPLNPDDAEDNFTLNQDPEVLRYTGDKPFESVEDARAFLCHYDQYERFGVGRLAVTDRMTGSFMGWCGLKFTPEKNEYDIGFRLARTHWNQGLATETARACLADGFKRLGMDCIVGRAMRQNIGSIRVLEKIGMSFKQPFDFAGNEGVIYEINRISDF